MMVGRLCKLAFDDEPHFPELVSAILPLVSHEEGATFNLPLMGDKDKLITKNYPNQVLELLAAVLPDDVSHWPYGVTQTLERLSQAKPKLVSDPRMIRLKGSWDRR